MGCRTAVGGRPTAERSDSSAPWSNCSCTPSTLSLDNLKGRLAARAARNVDKSSEGLNTTISTDWRFTFFSYDPEGRVKKKKVFAPGLGEVTLTYDRDRQGRLTERKTVLNDQGGATFYQAYTYNERGTVKEIYASTSQPDPSTDAPDVEYRYAAHGAIDSVKYEGSSWIARDYDDRDRLTDVGNTSSPVGFAGSYAYDADGTVDQALSAFSGSSNYAYYFSYDALDRLTSADYGGLGLGGKYDVSNITYDENGNLKTLERRGDQGSLVDDLSYTYGGTSPNRLTSLSDGAGTVHGWDAGGGSFDYTDLGQMAESPAPQGLTGAVYGASGQLLEAEQGGQTTSYRYSGAGQRTFKQVGTQSATYYVRDGAELLAVVEGSSVRHWNITRPDGPAVGRHEPGGSRRYYVTDLLGSIRAVLDGSGSVDAIRNYYPFGLPLEGRYDRSSPATQEDFTGHEKDTETDLHYAGARYYSGAFGRWTRMEPLLGGNPKSLLKDGKGRLLQVTPYGYSFNNPTTLRDPDGRFPIWDVADVAFAVQSVSAAIQDPSATNVGIAAVDVAAAALPIVPSTGVVRNGIAAVKHGDEAIQAIRTGVRKGKRALDIAQASRALGRAANKAESVAGLRKVATKVDDIAKGKSISLGTGSNASVIARNLAGKGAKAIPKGGGKILFKGGNLDEGTKVILRKTSRSGAPTVEVQSTNLRGDVIEEFKFRTQKAGFLFE